MASKVNLKKGGVTAELYTKEAVDTLLGKKADTDNPMFNGHIGGDTAYFENNIQGGSPYLGYFINELAFNTQKGGSCVLKNLTTGKTLAKDADMNTCFNAQPDFYYLPDGIAKGDTVEITVKLHREIREAPMVGISFGHAYGVWGASYMKIEVGRSLSSGSAETPPTDIQWKTIYEKDTSAGPGPIAYAMTKGGVGDRNFVSYIRFTMKNWYNDMKCITQIFAFAYDSAGVADAYLSRGGGDMYGGVSFAGSAGIRLNNGRIEFNPNKADLNIINFGSGIVGLCSIGYGSGDGGIWNPGVGKDNLTISSWFSIGFHDNCFGHDYISMNLREGIIRARKLQDTDTGKQTSIGDIATLTELDEVRKIAEGKTATYAVNAQKVDSTKYCNHKLNIAKSELSTTSVKIDKQGVTKLLDINNKEIDLSTLQVGDIVFTAEQTIKDWWFAGTTAAYFAFYGFDADTPDLSGYVKNTELANYTPLTDFNNLKGSLGTASKCDYVETIKDSLIDTSTPGTLKKKELPTASAVRAFVDTLFVRKANFGEAANHGVDTSIGTLSVLSANLPTTAAVMAYVAEKTKLKTINGNTISGEGNLALPTASKKVQFTRGDSASGSYLLLGKFKTTTDAGNGGAVHIHGYLGEWDGVDAKTLLDVIISNRGGLSIKGTVKGKVSTKYDLFCTKDSSDNYYVYIKAQTFTIGQLLIDYDDWDEFGGFLWLCEDTWTNGYAGSSNVSCISKLLPHDTYYGSFDASTGETDVKAVTGGPSGSIVTVFGKSYSNGASVSIQKLSKIWTDHDCIAISGSSSDGTMISATGFVPPGATYHCFADTAIEVYVHVFDL